MSPQIENITGVILAGGKSRRMGKDKALLKLGDKTLIQHVADILRTVFQRVVIISDHGCDYQFLNLPLYPDIYKNSGPLAGIHSALVHSKTESCFITSCDTPYITPELITHIIDSLQRIDSRESLDICIPSVNGKLHPLCGVYSQRCLSTIQDCLSQRTLRVEDAIKKMNTNVIDITDKFPASAHQLLININTVEEYERTLNIG